MTFPVFWTAPARVQLAEFYDYISESNVSAADRQVAIITEWVDRLVYFPEMGRQGRRYGTRELVISKTPYIVVYRIRLSTVRILAIMHGARQWPRNFRD